MAHVSYLFLSRTEVRPPRILYIIFMERLHQEID